MNWRDYAAQARSTTTNQGGHNHASHAGQSHADWLRYSNSGAIRNDPISQELINAMSFLGDMGITMDVISGGQEPIGTPGAQRTGSTRHDHGNAADVDFYQNGRLLDWNNPADLPILQQIVSTARSRGVTGIGAGDDYMGAGRFHIGFGNPAVWGAGGSSANAPDWLVEAYNSAPSTQAPQTTRQAAPQAGGNALAAMMPQPNAMQPQMAEQAPQNALALPVGLFQGLDPSQFLSRRRF